MSRLTEKKRLSKQIKLLPLWARELRFDQDRPNETAGELQQAVRRELSMWRRGFNSITTKQATELQAFINKTC